GQMTLPVDKRITNVNVVESLQRWTLNFTDIVNNNNKFYNLEILKDDKGKMYLYTVYGRVGAGGAKEYRVCESQTQAEKEAQGIIKSKTKKGYVEIKLAKADIGSAVGQAKLDNSVSVESLRKMGATVVEEPAAASKLHHEVQNLVRTWF